jgi:ABC-type phosphate transport system substrate-binding protein
MRLSRHLPVLCSAAALLLGAASAAASDPEVQDVRIVVRADHPAATIERAALADIYLRRIGHWPDGTPAVPFDLGERHPVREGFSRGVLGKSARAIAAYWNQQVFMGRGTPPVTKADEARLLAAVRGTPGSVGYVAGRTPPGPGLKVLGVVP